MRRPPFAFLSLASLLFAGSAHATTVNFDTLPPGTVLANQYPCLQFREVLSHGTVPITVAPLTSGNNVLAVNGDIAFNARHAAIDIIFCTPQRSVSIDAAAFREHYYVGTSNNRPFLEAWDVNNAYLGKVLFQGPLPTGWSWPQFQTLSFVSGSANIGKVRLSAQASVDANWMDGIFDTLSYSTTSSPTGLMVDDFSRSVRGRWTTSVQGGGIAAVVDAGALQFKVEPTLQGADVVNRWDHACRLQGDFDLRVDYAMSGQQTGVRAALAAWGAGHMERSSLSKSDIHTAGEYYITNISGYVPGFVPTPDAAGSLRLARTGSQMTSYYRASGSNQWTALYTQWVPSGSLPFGLQVWTHSWAYAGTGAKVSFDNLELASGQLVDAYGYACLGRAIKF
jgi:hypothetical protein